MQLRGDICFKRQLAAFWHHKYPQKTSKDISQELGEGYTARWVRSWWNKNPEETEEFKDGRKGRDMSSISKINPTIERIVVRNMHGAKKVQGGFKRKLSQRQMVKKLKDKYKKSLCRSSVRNILKKKGLKYHLRSKKVRLTENHMKRRLKFARFLIFFNQSFF
jgi:hypothetical protein